MRHPARTFALKRAMDVAFASVALVLLAPLLAAIALALWLTQGRPVLFHQVRPGLRGRPFTLVKFRTMRPARLTGRLPERDEDRLTRLGPLLRTTGLDELPELWNVLRGDMSLVGPRPLLLEYLPEYTSAERRRHDMRPGITGWAVVHGRNTLAFRERLRLDVWYVDHWSLRLDLAVLARTAVQVLRGSGAAVTEDDAALGFPTPGGRSPVPESPAPELAVAPERLRVSGP